MFSRIVNSVSNALDLNIATLSGCVDIIVVPQKDGTLRSTPFHVRFGKTKLLKSREKEVSIQVNGKETDLKMKLGAAGEAYFEELISCQELPDSVDIPSASSDSSFIDHTNEADYCHSSHHHQSPLLAESELHLSSADILLANCCVEFSLCGHILSDHPKSKQQDNQHFNEHIVTWGTLNANSALWYHPSLMCRFDYQPPFYPAKVALPLLASWIAFNRSLTADALQQLKKIKLQVEVAYGRSLMTWVFGTNTQTSQPALQKLETANSNDSTSMPVQSAELKMYLNQHVPLGIGAPSQKTVRRTLRPTEQQLALLHLKDGVNLIEFCVTSSLQGDKRIRGSIYLWPQNAKIIVSDIDGTITKSDVLGQLMPIVGRDWSHRGVAELYSKFRENNYRLLYLTSRAIGQADSTRDYLFGLRQDASARLPDGPLIMSPDRLFPSFKREVIEKKPYVFKIAALRDVRNLFPNDYNPFYAGFGNKETDYRAYVHIGIPESRVFIIDPSGTLHHINTTYTTTYEDMGDVCDCMFPPLTTEKNNYFYEEEQVVTNMKRIGFPAREYRMKSQTFINFHSLLLCETCLNY